MGPVFDGPIINVENGSRDGESECSMNSCLARNQSSSGDPKDLPGYPDRRPTQRLGIIPDVRVIPTIAGIAASCDEVPEKPSARSKNRPKNDLLTVAGHFNAPIHRIVRC